MLRRSKGINEFFYYAGPLWRINSRIRQLREKNESVASIISPDWNPISVEPEIRILQEELTPWLCIKPTRFSTLATWDEDYWMIKSISNISSNKSLLKKIYSTLISLDEQQFYKDYCPVRWVIRDDMTVWRRFNDFIDIIKPEDGGVSAYNFAVSVDYSPRPFIKSQAKKYKIEISDFRSIVLWARRDFLKIHGMNNHALFKRMGTNCLKYGFPYVEEL